MAEQLDLMAYRPPTFANTARALGGRFTLTEKDIDDFATATRKVFEFMSDGEWHSASAIIQASGQREGLRRMRELRQWFAIESRRTGSKRDFEYRLAAKDKEAA